MPRKLLPLIACAGFACGPALADPLGSVGEVLQPVWIQLDDAEAELDPGNDIGFGDRIVAGPGGRAEFELWSGVALRLYPDTEIRLQPAYRQDDDGAEMAELYLARGRICLETGPPTSRGRNFRLNVAARLLATIHQSAHLCALRRDEASALGLLGGSVQLDNTIEPGTVVLSQAGFEFVLADDGSYRLLPAASSTRVAGIDEQPFIDPAAIAAGANGVDAADEPVDAGDTEPAPAEANDWVYTVYLFSTRSREVADEVNRKLRQAGHDTRIIASSANSPARFRVAVSGFASREAARSFSDSIVGRYGIRDTWIGRDRPSSGQ